MNTEQHPLDIARDQVSPYGYAILPDGSVVSPKGRQTGVRLVCLRSGRYQARAKEGNTLFWSGPDASKFLESFWFARKTETN